jgi:hypothetical protein
MGIAERSAEVGSVGRGLASEGTMNRFGVVGAMALGVTLGWACSGVHTEMFDSGAPDASAQGPDGGGGVRPEPRVLEFECDPDTFHTIIPEGSISIAEAMGASWWWCGRISSDPAYALPESTCRPTTPIGVSNGVFDVRCNAGNDLAPISVRAVLR